MADNYKYRDVRMQEVRERVEILKVDDLAEVYTVLCAECGAVLDPNQISYILADDLSDERVWCPYCIEEWSPLEEEGRVPPEFREEASTFSQELRKEV